MRDGSNFGGHGVAWVEGSIANPLYMYSVVTGCLASCESVWIHEVGHNMGNHHDRYTAAWQNSGLPSGSAYGYAFCKSGALNCLPDIAGGTPGACGATQPSARAVRPEQFPRHHGVLPDEHARGLPVFQSGHQLRRGRRGWHPRPCGLSAPAGQATDTATSMNGRRLNLQNIKAQVSAALMPGSLQFTQTTYSGAESGGTLTFTVSRMRDRRARRRRRRGLGAVLGRGRVRDRGHGLRRDLRHAQLGRWRLRQQDLQRHHQQRRDDGRQRDLHRDAFQSGRCRGRVPRAARHGDRRHPGAVASRRHGADRVLFGLDTHVALGP
jgi:hypothetical protein